MYNVYYADTDLFYTLLLTSLLHKETRWQAGGGGGGSYLLRKRNLWWNEWFIHPSGILFLPGLHSHTCSGNKSRWDLPDPQQNNFRKVFPCALWGHSRPFELKRKHAVSPHLPALISWQTALSTHSLCVGGRSMMMRLLAALAQASGEELACYQTVQFVFETARWRTPSRIGDISH